MGERLRSVTSEPLRATGFNSSVSAALTPERGRNKAEETGEGMGDGGETRCHVFCAICGKWK